MSYAAPVLPESTLWYLARSSGFVSLVLFTVSVALGLLTAGRVSSPAWPRFVTETLHRNVSVLGLVVVAVHIAAVVADEFVPIAVVDAVLPFISDYLPLWVGLGTIAFDVMLTLVLTGLLRTRMTYGSWRRVHWSAYLGWPVAVAHTIGIGTDRVWVLVVVGVSVLAVLLCGGYRLAGWRYTATRRPA